MRLIFCYNVPEKENEIVKYYENRTRRGMNNMMKIGGMELLVILIVALFAIGPERMPKVARTLGRSLAAFKKSMNEATSELRDVSDEFKAVTDEISSIQKDMKDAIKSAGDELEKAEKEAEQAINETPKTKAEDIAEEKTEEAAEKTAGETPDTDEAPVEENNNATDAQLSAAAE